MKRPDLPLNSLLTRARGFGRLGSEPLQSMTSQQFCFPACRRFTASDYGLKLFIGLVARCTSLQSLFVGA